MLRRLETLFRRLRHDAGGRTGRQAQAPATTLAVTLLLGIPAVAADAPPQRIVSMNLCNDQYLLLLAEPARIASITWLGADPQESPLAARAAGLPLNHGHAEEIIPLRPDLVLAGRYGAAFSVALLRRRGYRVAEIDPATDLTSLRRGLREVAGLIGARERGARLLARFDRELAALAPSADPAAGSRASTTLSNDYGAGTGTAADWPSALFYAGYGFSAGAGTLQHDLLRAVGLRNLAAETLRGSGYVDLETLLRRPPDLLIVSGYHRDSAALANSFLNHPALRALPALRLRLPDRLLSCTPDALLTAARRLHAARRQLTPARAGVAPRR